MSISRFPFSCRSFSLGLGLFFVVCFTFPLFAGEMRTWTDSTGKFQIEASFVALKGDKVELKKSDGSSMVLPLDKLSAADQTYAKNQAAPAENPFASPDTNPFRDSKPAEDSPKSSGGSEVADAKPSELMLRNKVVQANWGNADMVDFMDSGTWNPISPRSVPAPSIAKPRAFRIPPKSDFFDSVTGRIVKPREGFVAIGYKNDGKMHNQAQHTRIAVCDIKQKGRVVNQASVPMSLQIKKDESYEQKVRETEKFTNKLYETVRLPAKLMKSENGVTFGTSKVTPNGIL